MRNIVKRSVHLLHFVTSVDERRGMVSFCCESQPLTTVRSHGLPVRCPFCQQGSPVGGEQTVVAKADVWNPNPRMKISRHREQS